MRTVARNLDARQPPTLSRCPLPLRSRKTRLAPSAPRRHDWRMTDVRAKVAQQFIEALPHCRALGMRVLSVGNGVAEIEMPYDTRFVGAPSTGVLHGGAGSTLLGPCGGAAVMSHPGSPSVTATLDLRIDYMRPATPGQTIRARAECYHITRSVAFVRADATDGDRETPVASAAGAFTVAEQ